MRNLNGLISGALLLSAFGVAHAEDREVAPQVLPMKWSAFVEPMSSSASTKNPSQLPEQMKPFVKGSSLDVSLDIESLKGEVFVVSPMSGKELLKEGRTLKIWDKLITAAKSTVELSTGEDVEWVLGAQSVLQLFAEKDGTPRLRLFKGKLRVASSSSNPVSVETLNAHAMIHKSTVDIKIAAMNTLVAPREGQEVKVLTQKAHQFVPVGTYGLVMADGALVFTGGKGKK